MKAITDYLNITVPVGHILDVRDEVVPILHEVGAVAQGRFLFKVNSGVYKIDELRSVARFSASGAVLRKLRELNVLMSYLSVFAGRPHRVTLLHAALDVPVDAPPEVEAIYRKARGGGFRLTRKAIPPENIRQYLGPGVDGRDTGTVYLGKRNSEVWAKVYDKRQERIDNAGVDPGPLLRYEISASSKVGVSLVDAADPDALFWHFAVPGFFRQRPEMVALWEPRGEGFDCEKERQLPLPWATFQRQVETSAALASLIEFADIADGGHENRPGRGFLCRYVMSYEGQGGLQYERAS